MNLYRCKLRIWLVWANTDADIEAESGVSGIIIYLLCVTSGDGGGYCDFSTLCGSKRMSTDLKVCGNVYVHLCSRI